MDVNFMGGMAPDPAADPQGFARAQNMAKAMVAQGAKSPQGQMAGGVYVAPSPMSYVNQLAGAAAGAQQMQTLQGAQRASNILNGVTPATTPMFPGLFGAR